MGRLKYYLFSSFSHKKFVETYQGLQGSKIDHGDLGEQVYTVLVLVLNSRLAFMIILCIGLNYYYLKTKRTHIHPDPKRTPISFPYINLYSTKPDTYIIVILFNIPYLSPHLQVEGGENYILKRIARRNP